MSMVARLGGAREWPTTRAKVTGVDQISEGGRGGAWRRISFQYQVNSEFCQGNLKVDSYSSDYELAVGDEFDIQFNPRNPSQYYSEEAQSTFGTIRYAILAVGALFAIYVALTVFLRR